MSYLVLARKSRPQKFAGVVGQRPVVKTLQNSIIRNRVAHAILFSGVRGVGKTTLARIMAKAINCQAEAAARPCDECPPCKEIASGSSLDLYEIDGASNRGIQEIRELKEKIRFLPTNAQFKVIIIDEVHMLTTEAFNALLKTLEEPPAHVYFMFATTEIHKIPITILSRCQQYELKRVSAVELTEHFAKLATAEGYTIEPAALSLIVREAAGSVRDGLSLLDQMFSFGEKEISSGDVVEVLGLVSREVLMGLTRALLEGNKKEVFSCLEEIFNFGVDLRRFMEDLLGHFRNLLLCQIDGCTKLVDLPAEELEEFQKIARDYSSQTVHLKLTLLMEVAESLRYSAQPRLALETSLLKIVETANVIPVSSLLGQLEQILATLPEENPPVLPQVTKAKEVVPPQPQKPVETAAPPPVQEKKTEKIPHKVPAKKPPVPKQVSSTPDKPVVKAATPPKLQPPPPPEEIPLPEEPVELQTEQQSKFRPHEKDVRGNWPQFIQYVRDRKEWMAQDLLRADSVKQDVEGELHLIFSDGNNCSVLKQKGNHQLLTEFALDFFQKPLKVRIIVPELDDSPDENGEDPPHIKRQQLVNDPLVVMATEIFNGQVGDIRIGPRSR